MCPRKRCKRGSRKYRRRKLCNARRQMRDARRRRERLHELTTALSRRFAALRIIAPPIREVTASGRGGEREHGAAVDVKAAINRHILDQAPATAIAMLIYKLSERGGEAKVIEDTAPPAAIGAEIVSAAKTLKRSKRSVKHVA